ncbi:hypothetical protein QCN27_00715 [Cereibacter sp. SYSU M97828]|nr:hypothetical protein [Cereibacter flavus]
MRDVPTWRIVLAFLLDLATAFWAFGFLVGWATGGLTGEGFSLSGGPALLFIALVIAYFPVGNRLFGGTLWKHILRARR